MIADRTLTLDPTIFRTYDIRGIVGKTLTEEGIYFIGKAIGSLLREQGETQILLARDGRLSSPHLANVMGEGLLAAGCDVIDLGMVPTPLLYFGTHLYDTRAGVMVTGSHNPGNYNGVKAVIANTALTAQQIQDLYHRINKGNFVKGAGIKREENISERYIDDLACNVGLQRPLRVVVDAANGVPGAIAPHVYRALGCEVVELYCEVDGHFPNHEADPSQEKNLQDLIDRVQETSADIGLAFDGDGDRLGVVTNKGTIITADRLLMFYAKSLLAKHPGATVIYDVKCSDQLGTLVRQHGGNPIMWKTGHSLIKAKLAEEKALLAGEMSGHFFFKDRWYGFDDAIYAGARVLEILAADERDSETIFAEIPISTSTPELKIPVADQDKFHLMQQLIDNAQFADAIEIMTIDGLRVNFAEGWGLVRPSNTSPYLIMRFEAVNQIILEEIQNVFRHWILSVRPDLVLPF